MGNVNDIERKLREVEAELARLDAERDRVVEKLRKLRAEKAELLQASASRQSSVARKAPSLFDVHEPAANYETNPSSSGDGQDTPAHPPPSVTENSPAGEKIKLFLCLFRGRDDIDARRFESRRTGKSGYAPDAEFKPYSDQWAFFRLSAE